MDQGTPFASDKEDKQKKLISFLQKLLTTSQYEFELSNCQKAIPLILKRQRSDLESYVCSDEIDQIYSQIQSQEQFKGYFKETEPQQFLPIEDIGQTFYERLKIKQKFKVKFLDIMALKNYSEAQKILNTQQKAELKKLLIQYGLSQKADLSISSIGQCQQKLDQSESLETSKQSILNEVQKVSGPFDPIVAYYLTKTQNIEASVILFLVHIIQLLTSNQYSSDSISYTWQMLQHEQKLIQLQKIENLQINLVSPNLLAEVKSIIKLCQLSFLYIIKSRINHGPQIYRFSQTLQRISTRINQLVFKQEFLDRVKRKPRPVSLKQFQNHHTTSNRIEFLREYIFSKEYEFHNMFKVVALKVIFNCEEFKFEIPKQKLKNKLEEIASSKLDNLILFYQIAENEYQPFDITNDQIEYSKIKVYERQHVNVNLKGNRQKKDYSKDLSIKQMTQFTLFQINKKQQNKLLAQNCRVNFVFTKNLDRALSQDQLIHNIEEDYGDITHIQIELQSLVSVYYKGEQHKFKHWQNQPISILKTKIKQKLEIPVESQILQYQSSNKTIQLHNKETLAKLKILDEEIDVSLLIKTNLQFYGFHTNIQLSYDKFKEFFIQNEKQRNQYLSLCKLKQDEQTVFFNKAMPYIFSSIKKRLDLESVIRMFREEVSEHTKQQIWTSSKQINTFNPTFLLYYMLYNSDEKLRVQIMNLVKQSYPLPVYFKEFSSISNIKNQWKINEELLWVLKNETNIVSIGLHNEEGKSQYGKSNLLNRIFYTNFIDNFSRHNIVSGCPQICLRIYGSTYPVNLIDISQKTPKNISDDVLTTADFVILHSWKSEEQTEEEIKRIKTVCKDSIYVLTIMRDLNMDSQDSWLVRAKKLINNTIELYNLSARIDPITVQIIMKQVKKLIHQQVQKVILQKHNKGQKIQISLFKNEKFNSFQKQLEGLSQIVTEFRPVTKRYKQLQNSFQSIKQFENKLKQDIDLFVIHPLISTIMLFVLDNMNESDLLMQRLRQKVKSYRQEFQQKYKILIYAKKDFDRLISEQSSEYQDKLQQYIKIIKSLPGLKPFSTDSRVQLLKGLSQAIDQYEDNIKPELISIELIWRQLYLAVKINPAYKIRDSLLLIEFITRVQKKQIFNGQPFQLLDGDSLRMPKKIIKNIFDSVKGTAATVIILGPQSSGKSTLLNYLFGCDFKTSQGRCTRGVYGTYYNISNSSMFSCESVFLIDTEGLLAITNKKDQKVRADFDSKLILFCLAVSDFVIVNTKSDLDSETIGKLKACKQRLPSLSQNSNPQFWLVMNQSQSSDLTNKGNDVNRLQQLFDLGNSRCLSQAFDTKVLSSQQICILGNDILTKKKSRNDFEKMTLKLQSDLMHRISMKSFRYISEIIDKMEVIWSTIERYPDLGKNANKDVKQIDSKMNNWKEKHAQELNILKDELINQFKAKNKKNDQVENQFSDKKREFEQSFIKVFSQKHHDRSLRERVQSKKKVISEQFDYIFKKLTHDMQDHERKKKMKIEQQEGNIDIKTQIKRINQQQSEKQIVLTEQQKNQRFQKVFNKTIQKLQKSVDVQKQAKDQFKRVKQYYQSRIKQYSLSTSFSSGQIVLPKFKIEPIIDCTYQQYKQMLLQQFQGQRNANMIIQNSDLPHTNVLAGGRTDASLKYFNMNDYFEKTEQTTYIIITKYGLSLAFKYYQFQNHVRKQFQLSKRDDEKKIISSIVIQINQCLIHHDLKFSDIQKATTFVQQIVNQIKLNKNFFQKVLDFIFNNKSQCPELVYVSHNNKCVDVIPSKYINYSKLQQLLLTKKQKSKNKIILKHFSQGLMNNVINIDLICNQVALNTQINEVKKRCIEKFSRQIQKQCLFFGVKINGYAYVNQILQNSYIYYNHLIFADFKLVRTQPFQSFQQFKNQLLKLVWFNDKIILKQYRYAKKLGQLQVCLAQFKKSYLKPKENKTNYQIRKYIEEQNRERMIYLQKKDTLMFLWQQLHSKGSFSRLFLQFDRIIEDCTIKKFSLAKTIEQIFSGVTKQIQIFNDDISQLSRKLTFNFQGSCHMYAIFMTWKNIFIKQQKMLQKPIDQWKEQKEKQFKYFMNMTSNKIEKICEGQVEQFIQKILEIYSCKIDKKKQEMFKKEIDQFKQNITRDAIQKQTDREIFKVGSDAAKMILYIEQPQKILEQQFKNAIERSIESLHHEINKQMYHIKVYNQITQQISEIVNKIIFADEIQENQGLFSSFFKIQSKIKQNLCLIDGSLNQKSSIIFMKYLLNNLLNKQKQCYDCQIFTAYIKEDKEKIQFNTTFTQQVRQYFESIEKDDLSMTNIVIFITKLSKRFPEIKKEFLQKMAFTQKEIQRCFISEVNISFCSEKCPCCKRICGFKGSHNGPHQCVYGHQIRAFAGTMFQNGNASVCRCEDMTDTSQLTYNGRKMTWKEFKDQQAIRGWNFDDLFQKDLTQQQQFFYVWKTVGNHFCNKYQMKNVEFNNAAEAYTTANIHFIMALDESGSMNSPKKWPQVIKTLNQTLPIIKTTPNYEQKVKISVLLLSNVCRIHQQGLSPNNTNFNSIVPSWGGTRFGPTFDTAYSLMNKYHENSNIMFILLTDGEAEYPATQISQIKQLKNSSKSKIYYSGIEFMTTGKVMSNLKTQLDGKNYNVSTQKELVTAFTKAIEVINSK